MSQCTRTVEVRDTAAPSISPTLNRTVLWPPNHKLVAVAELGGSLKTELIGVYPNPLRGTATVAFSLATHVRGTRVVTLARGTHGPGRHLAAWDGRDPDGRSLSGIYFVRFAAGAQRSAHKIAVMP